MNYTQQTNSLFTNLCWSFLKVCRAIPIKNKEAIAVRNAIAHVFIQGYPEILQSDNGREFVNKILDAYLTIINLIIFRITVSSSESRSTWGF